MSDPAEVYEAMLVERFGPRPAGSVRPVLLSRQRADASGLLWPADIPRTPPGPDLTGEALRMAGYGWTARQIAALLRLDITAVVRILARAGRGPAAVPDRDLEGGLAA